jgi:hypothetical protein
MSKIVLSETEQKELMGLLPFNLDASFEFTPEVFKLKKKDTDEYLIRSELWPVFKIRPFSKSERDAVRRMIVDLNLDAKKVAHEDVTEWARKITIGWKNLIDLSTGEAIEYKADNSGGADKAIFGSLPETCISSLLYRAVSASGLVNSERMGLGY